MRCGAVWIIFFKNRTVRCGAVIRRTVVPYGAGERALYLKNRCTVGLNRSHTIQKLPVRDFLPNVKEILYI